MPVFCYCWSGWSLLSIEGHPTAHAVEAGSAALEPLRRRPEPNPVLMELLLAALLAIPRWFFPGSSMPTSFASRHVPRAADPDISGSVQQPPETASVHRFDADDNLRMAELPSRPLHVVNATLNLVKATPGVAAAQKRNPSPPRNTARGVGGWGYQESRLYADRISLGGPSRFPARRPTPTWATLPLGPEHDHDAIQCAPGAWRPNPASLAEGTGPRRVRPIPSGPSSTRRSG